MNCTTIMIVELVVTSGMGSLLIRLVWLGIGWFWYSLCENFVITLCPFVPL
jgi:hypothetical protein